MPKELVIAASPHETRVAILEDGLLCEIYIEREKEFALVGSIYKGRVTRVLPGMQSAFVDIALDSDAFLYVGDFFENLEDYDHVVTTVEGKVEKMEQQGGAVFAPPSGEMPAEPSAQPPDAAAVESAPPPPRPVIDEDNRGNMREPGQPSHQPPGQRPHGSPSAGFQRQDRPPRNFGGGQGHHRGDRPAGGDHGPASGDRGADRGGDRGPRRGRWGRGGRDRRGGRDLPPSKYASPRPYTPRPQGPQEQAPYEPQENYEPVILPGESLAKYRDRAPGASGAPAAPPAQTSEPETRAATTGQNLPSSLYADSSLHASGSETREAESARPPRAPEMTEEAGESAEDAEVFADYQAMPEEPLPGIAEPHAHDAHDAHDHDSGAYAAPHAPELSDEDVTVLAEQLAEARQEEAVADAEAEEAHEMHGEEADENDSDESAGAIDESDVPEHEAVLADSAAIEPSDDEAAIDENVARGETDADLARGEEPPPFSPEHAPELNPETAPMQHQPTSARISDPQRARFQRPMRRGGRQRGGGRPDRHRGDHRHQQRPRPQLIADVLKAGQEIIVQIAKEPLGKKGARITSHVALPGRFLVYMPTVNHIGVSRRIASAEERSRLRHLVTEAKSAFPGGFIVRTAAEGAPDDEIRADVEFLGRTWEKIRAQGENRKAPALLHRDLNLVERILRDYLSNDYSAIWIDNEDEFSKVVEFVGRFQPKLVSRVKLYTKPAPIFEEFGIQQELDRALRPKVWLKSGGYIVINHTEALVAIDVNTGKYVGRGSNRLEDTIVKTNLEAVKEIIRQIRLRDLGGIIVLDFIDMEERRNREKVMQALESALRADRAPSKALAFNEFGLVCVTRKRTKQALERVLCQPCPYCTGSGMVKSVPTICYEIQAEARKMAVDLDAASVTLRVHPEIAKALKTREATLIEELEQATRKSVIITADPALHWEQYDIY